MDVFAALADPTRRRLLARLAGGPCSVGELAADEPMSRPAISKHLRLLRESGVVDVVADGRLRHYRLRSDAFTDIRRYLDALEGAPIPPEAFDALDMEVRRTARDRATTSRARSSASENAGHRTVSRPIPRWANNAGTSGSTSTTRTE